MNVKDLNTLTKAKLIEYIESLQNTPDAALATEVERLKEQNAEIISQNQQLIAALVGSRNATSESEEDEATYKVYNVSGMTIVFSVSDARGLPKQVRLEKKTDVAYLTRAQLEELEEFSPHFFDEGYLSVPGYREDNPNTIRNIDAFIESIEFEDIRDRIQQIDSVTTLFSIYNHIQTARFTHLNEDGTPVVEKDASGNVYRTVREKQVSPKMEAVEIEVQRRIDALTGVKVKRDAGD